MGIVSSVFLPANRYVKQVEHSNCLQIYILLYVNHEFERLFSPHFVKLQEVQ